MEGSSKKTEIPAGATKESSRNEKLPQMSPEDIAEMQSQIQILREMLEERRVELAKIANDPVPNQVRIDELKTEIEELEFEIAGREV